MSVAIIGGAGYIGSHVVHSLQEHNESVVVVDDLSTGHVERIKGTSLLQVDIAADTAVDMLTECFRANGVTAVMHFAAKKQVGESMEQPLHYYRQNVQGTVNVLEAVVRAGVLDFVFSSSAAVYGAPSSGVVTEESATHPINPYGESKLIGEWLVQDVCASTSLRATSLRYFNVVGAGAPALADTGLFNLIPIALDRVRQAAPIDVFGKDYSTPDGTCIRDYVHIVDLVEAHLAALTASRNRDPQQYAVYNVGTGSGASVLEVLDVVAQVTGTEVTAQDAGRRAGDPAELAAEVGKIAKEIGWRARYSMAEAIESTWAAMQS